MNVPFWKIILEQVGMAEVALHWEPLLVVLDLERGKGGLELLQHATWEEVINRETLALQLRTNFASLNDPLDKPGMAS